MKHEPSGRSRAERPISVVHCIANFLTGGTELNMVRTLERLDRQRFDVRVLALRDIGELRERVFAAGIPIEIFDFSTLQGPLKAKRAAQVVARLKELRPDVLHSHDCYTNALLAPCARLAGVPLVK